MSRIGNKPILIPAGVTCSLADGLFHVSGPRGKLTQAFTFEVKVRIEEGVVAVAPSNATIFSKALHGTMRSIFASMIQGVVQPYFKDLEISGVGFRAAVNGNKLVLNLGYAEPREYLIPEGLSIEVKDNTKLKIVGVDKQAVGQAAARIYSYYPVEPYKGKGVRIIGKFVVRKEGKKTS